MIIRARHSLKTALYTSALSVFAVGTLSSALMMPVSANAQALTSPACYRETLAAGITDYTWTCLIAGQSGAFRAVSGIPGTSSAPDATALNALSTASAVHGFVQIGQVDDPSVAPGLGSVSIGGNAMAEGEYAMAIGYSTEADGHQGIAIGHLAQANSTNQVSVGPEAGHQSNEFGVSIGDMANSGVTPAGTTYQHNVAVGAKSRYSAVGNRNTAVGNYSGNNTTGDDNTSLGFYSLQAANGDGNTALGSEAGFQYQGELSVMTGMMAGHQAQGNMNAFFGSFAGQDVSGDGNTMIGAGSSHYDPSSTTEFATALGQNARSSSYGTAIGAGSMVATEGGIALGSDSVMDQTLATSSYVPVTNDASLPNLIAATAATAAGVSIGNSSTGTYRQIHNLAAGTLDTDAVNVAQLRTLDRALAAQIVRIDNLSQSGGGLTDALNWNSSAGAYDATRGGQSQKVTGVAAGAITATSTDAVNGSQLHATNQRVTTLETRVDSIDDRLAGVEGTASNAVTYATDTQGNRLNRVDLLGGDPNAPVVISNLAAGVANTDAVNVGQLKAGMADTLAAANTYADQVGQRTLQQANAYTDTMITNLNNTIGDVRSEARQAAAIGLAAASLRFADTPGATTVAVGGGGWQGEGAVAVGIGYTTRDNRFRSNATLTSAGGEVGIGGGLSWTFGAR